MHSLYEDPNRTIFSQVFTSANPPDLPLFQRYKRVKQHWIKKWDPTNHYGKLKRITDAIRAYKPFLQELAYQEYHHYIALQQILSLHPKHLFSLLDAKDQSRPMRAKYHKIAQLKQQLRAMQQNNTVPGSRIVQYKHSVYDQYKVGRRIPINGLTLSNMPRHIRG
eukprot:849375_1